MWHSNDSRKALKQSYVHCKAAGIAQQVDKRHADDAVHVENEIRLLRGGDLLHFERIVQQRRGGKVFTNKILRNVRSNQIQTNKQKTRVNDGIDEKLKQQQQQQIKNERKPVHKRMGDGAEWETMKDKVGAVDSERRGYQIECPYANTQPWQFHSILLAGSTMRQIRCLQATSRHICRSRLILNSRLFNWPSQNKNKKTKSNRIFHCPALR